MSPRHVSAKGCYKASDSGRLWSPGVALSWLLELSLVPWRPRSLSPRLTDAAAAAFPVGSSAGSEAECVSQRRTAAHTGDTDTAGNNDNHGQGTAFNNPQICHHQDSHKTQVQIAKSLKHKYK